MIIESDFDFVIPHAYIDEDCCGILYWDTSGSILCNECGKEFEIEETLSKGSNMKVLEEMQKLYAQAIDEGETMNALVILESIHRIQQEEEVTKPE